ncbi:MAG: hypothetical protein U1C46_05440 [Bacteroidales bacterium]|nr:hypothetical protein [Bacteroidales bacterium]MDZ4204244.1 hypothetical protein [Bacteroidales bacterium]
MKARLFITTIILSGAIGLYAQNQEDALRYSKMNLTGTARYLGLGGALGAVGADFSALSTNPAGLGLFRKSEYSLTPAFSLAKTETTYLGKLREDNRYNLNLANLGVVFAKDLTAGTDAPGWKMVQVGLGMNRLSNFNNRILLEGNNKHHSLLTGYAHQADGNQPKNLDQFTTKLAYDADLLWVFDSTNLYYDADVYRGGVLQQKSITTSGSINEMVFGIGSNYDDRFYLGASIGIPFVRYNYESIYTEKDNADTIYYFKSFDRFEEISTRGTGFNVKFGAILRATDWLRLGAAFHSPTFYSKLHDSWSYSMKSRFDNGKEYTSEAPDGKFDYELTTPMKAIGSAMVQFGKMGFVSAEYEFVDYSEAKLNSSTYKYFDENTEIREKYTAAHNLRFGAEWRLREIYIRGGYAMLGSPYKSGVNDGKADQLSLGFGIRDADYFVDFGYRVSSYNEDSHLYWVPEGFNAPVANNKFANQVFMITFGWRY